MELSKQEIKLFLPLPGLWSKILFYNILFITTKEFKFIFKTGKGIVYSISHRLRKQNEMDKPDSLAKKMHYDNLWQMARYYENMSGDDGKRCDNCQLMEQASNPMVNIMDLSRSVLKWMLFFSMLV